MPLTHTEQRTPKGRKYLRTVTSGHVTAEDAHTLTQVISKPENAGVGFLSLVEPGTDMSAEARKAFTSIGNQGATPVPVAIVVTSPPMRVLLSFVIRIAGSAPMTKFFGTEAEAKTWLEGELDK